MYLGDSYKRRCCHLGKNEKTEKNKEKNKKNKKEKYYRDETVRSAISHRFILVTPSQRANASKTNSLPDNQH